MKKKFGAITIILIILLIIRLIVQVVGAIVTRANIVYLSLFSVIAVLYLLILVGVSMKQKWGSILVMIIAIIDILFALALGGATGLGAGVMDLILIVLGYKEYKRISS